MDSNDSPKVSAVIGGLVASVLIPIVGIILFFIYIFKENYRGLAIGCLIASIISWVIYYQLFFSVPMY